MQRRFLISDASNAVLSWKRDGNLVAPLFLVHFDSLGKSVVVSPGTSLLEAARRAGLELSSVCNGQGWCGECRLAVLEGNVSPLTPDEAEAMSAADQAKAYRLACRTRVYGPVKVRLLPD